MYVQFDIDIIAILILIIVLINNLKNSGKGTSKRWLFRALIICDILILVLDMILLIIYGKPGMPVHILMQALQSIFLILCSLFCFFWAIYCAIRPGYMRNKLRILIMCVPIVTLIVFLFINYSTGLIFRITEVNTYERGPLFHITSLCTYSYVVFSIVQVLRNRRNLSKEEYYPFLFMPIFPMIVGIVQLVYSIEVLMVWPSIAIAVLVMQLYVLDEKINVDHLTGLYNRKYLDTYIKDLLNLNKSSDSDKNKQIFAALMLDIDRFKDINDTYGHVEGDQAIIEAANLLTKSVRSGDFVSRFGGDEFLIILGQSTKNTPCRVIKRIEENVVAFNAARKLPYDIEFSIGYKVFKKAEGLTAEEIISSIDGMMYIDKQSKIKSRREYSQIRFNI